MPLRPRPAGWVSPYEPGHRDDRVCAFIDVLDGFFQAMEQGKVHLFLPDPSYERRGGKPTWTEAELEALVQSLDVNTERELAWASRNKDMLCNAGPGFARLAVAQRLAMAQQLDLVLNQHEAALVEHEAIAEW